MAERGLERVGHHGRVDAMGVPRAQLPSWEDIQLLTAQLHRVPLLDDAVAGSFPAVAGLARPTGSSEVVTHKAETETCSYHDPLCANLDAHP